MVLLQQLIVLLVLVICGLSASTFLFWFLFKKDAPTYDEIRDSLLMD